MKAYGMHSKRSGNAKYECCDSKAERRAYHGRREKSPEAPPR